MLMRQNGVTDGRGSLERGAAQMMPGFGPWVMGRCWCFTKMRGGLEDQVRGR